MPRVFEALFEHIAEAEQNGRARFFLKCRCAASASRASPQCGSRTLVTNPCLCSPKERPRPDLHFAATSRSTTSSSRTSSPTATRPCKCERTQGGASTWRGCQSTACRPCGERPSNHVPAARTPRNRLQRRRGWHSWRVKGQGGCRWQLAPQIGRPTQALAPGTSRWRMGTKSRCRCFAGRCWASWRRPGASAESQARG